jgi:putative flippase GtrA
MNIANLISKARSFYREIFFYGVIGAGSAASDAIFYYLLTRFVRMEELSANAISVNVGIAISFLLNSNITFHKTDRIKKRATLFFLIGYAGLVLSTLILYVGVNLLNMNDLIVKFISIFFVAACQFLSNKKFTFSR